MASPFAMTIAEAAKSIGMSRASLYRLSNDGLIPIRKIGRRSVILTEDIANFCNGLKDRKNDS